MPEMDGRSRYLLPGILALVVIGVVGFLVVDSNPGDEEPPVETTTTVRPPGTTTPMTLLPPTTVLSKGPPGSITGDVVAEPKWSRAGEWAGTLGGDQGHGIMLAPGVAAGVYHEDGTVFAVDLDDGEKLWTRVVSARHTAALFAIQDGGVVIAGGPGYIIALNLLNGDEVWRTTFDRSLAPADALSESGRLYVTLGADGGTPQILALDIATGEIRWRSRLGGLPDVALHTGRLAIAEGVVMVGATRGVIGLDAGSGSVAWMAEAVSLSPGGSGASEDPTPPSSLLVSRGMVFVGESMGHLNAYDVATGDRVLSIGAGPGPIRPVMVSNGVLVFTDVAGVHGYDIADSSPAWTVPLFEPRAAVSADNRVFVIGGDTLMAVGEDGDVEWQRPTGDSQNQLAAMEGAIVIGGSNEVSFLEPVGGEIVRAIPKGTSIPMQVRKGQLVVSYSDGSLAMYEGTSPDWLPLPESPLTPRSRPRTVWSGTELISIMEYTGTGSVFAALAGTGFDPLTGEWRVLPEPPLTNQSRFHLEMANDEVLLFGGVGTDDQEFGAVFDIENGGWRAMKPTDVAPIEGAWTGNRLLVLGYVGDSRSLSLRAYDPEADTWTELQPPPSVMTAGTATWTNDHLVVWGEHDGGFVYDAASDTWASLPKAPIRGRRGHTATWTGEEVVIFGGLDSAGSEQGDGAAYNPGTNEWRRIGPGPLEARYNHQAVWTGSELLILGGNVGPQFQRSLKTAAAYDPKTDSWRDLPDLPAVLSTMSTTWVPDYGLVLWGSRGGFVADVEP